MGNIVAVSHKEGKNVYIFGLGFSVYNDENLFADITNHRKRYLICEEIFLNEIKKHNLNVIQIPLNNKTVACHERS